MPRDDARPPSTPEAAAPDTRNLFFQVFPSICLPMFLAAVDGTVVATALPNIAGTLGDVERISWVVVAYLMATTIAAAVYGKLGDAMGRRRLLFVALAVFMAASLACALAPTMLALILARLAQGAGGGGLMTLSQALVGEIVPPRERGRYQGYLAGTFMMASTIGPVAGGWLTQHFGWQSVFLVNLPLGLLAVALAFRLPTRAVPRAKFRFDWLGLALFTGFVAPLLLALERAQQMNLSDAAWIGALVGTAILSLVLLLRQERRTTSPLIPVHLLRQPSIWRADAMGGCVGAMIVSSVTFMPIYLQVVRGADPGQAGLLMLPLTAGIAVGSLVTGRLISKTGRTAIFPSIGQGIVALCWMGLAIGVTAIPLGQLPLVFLVTAFAMGSTMPVVQLTVQITAGPKHLGAASASVQFTRSIGAALGTAIVGAVLFATLAGHDPAVVSLFADVVQRGPQVLDAVPAEVRGLMATEVASAFRAAFGVIAGFGVIAMLLAWSLPMRRL